LAIVIYCHLKKEKRPFFCVIDKVDFMCLKVCDFSAIIYGCMILMEICKIEPFSHDYHLQFNVIGYWTFFLLMNYMMTYVSRKELCVVCTGSALVNIGLLILTSLRLDGVPIVFIICVSGIFGITLFNQVVAKDIKSEAKFEKKIRKKVHKAPESKV